MIRGFDLIVIGTGVAGSTVATGCRSHGWNVAIVDSRPFGGTCALRGCDPKKVLVGAAEAVDWIQRMQSSGIRADQLRINWPDLMKFKRTFTDPVPGRTERQMAEAGIATFHGRARFTGPNALQIRNDLLESRYFVIAAGAKPADLKIDGADLLATSDDFLDLDALPERIIFAGGGYIAFEFAHVALRAGSRVSIVHRDERPLVRFDPDLVDQLVEATRELGIKMHLQTEVKAVARCPGGLCVTASSPSGEQVLEADLVVHAAGRVPDIDDLDLAAAGVERERGGVKVNDYLQSTSNPFVYAAGDAAASGGPPLTPVAAYESAIVVQNLLHGNHVKPNYTGLPSVVFSIPPLASTGLREHEARELGYRFQTNLQSTASWYSSRRVREPFSGFKVLWDQDTGKILGAHLLGGQAGEIINVFALAIRHGLTAANLKDAFYAYPTHGSDIRYMF